MITEFTRALRLKSLLSKRSAFLFGARGTGKTTLLTKELPHAPKYDLLEEKTFLRLLSDSSILEQENSRPEQLIVIDEIQKLPKLLDEVQRLMTKKGHRFLLTGSSARKLKRSGANLLGGRARELQLFPLVFPEIPDFDLTRFLNRGGLPAIYRSDDPLGDLQSYISLYLREEVAAEAATRRVDLFARFLDVMALSCGEELHYQNLASDSGVPAKTLRNYVQILEDTLIGFHATPFESTRKRKAITRSKLYLFDLGVQRVLARRGEVEPGSELFGKAFEHFIALELRAATRYLKRDLPIQYWRTKSGYEVDFVLGDWAALEVKSTEQVNERHLKGLRALKEERLLKHYWVVSRDPRERFLEGVRILPWRQFLEELWSGALLPT